MALDLPSKIQRSIGEFTGRRWILPRLRQWLETGSDRLFLIVGKPGSGKSMLSAWLGGEGPEPDDANALRDLRFVRSAVHAVHFCQATSGNSPRAFAESVAKQLARTVEGYGAAVVSGLSGGAQIANINVNMNVQRAERSQVTGVELTLQLGGLTDEPSFDRLFREPLKAVYENGRVDPIVVIVDALDEALTYSGIPNIPHLLGRLADLPPHVRLILTTRPDGRVTDVFTGSPQLDVVKDEPKGENSIRFYSYERLKALQDPGRGKVADLIADAAAGQFLYAYLVLNAELAKIAAHSDPESIPLPDGLTGYYNEYMLRELLVDRSRWHQSIRPVLGLIAVSQGDGLQREQIEHIVNADIELPLEALEQYLEGQRPDGPFRPFHRSLVDFLVDYRHIKAAERHAAIGSYYQSIRNGSSPLKKWDDYGVRYAATHLADSLAGDRADDVTAVRALVRLVLSPVYRAEQRRRFNDVAAMQLDLQRAMRVASQCDDDDSIAPLIEVAVSLGAFMREELRPERLFDAARQGLADETTRRISLFNLGPEWRAALQLILAWSALDSNRPAAAELRATVRPEVQDDTLRLLIDRVDASFEGRAPVLQPLPPTPTEGTVRAVVDQISGRGNPELCKTELQADGLFLSSSDGPLLVSFALADPIRGNQYLKEYLSVHTSYQYEHYRQASLWVLMNAVLRHPDPAWVRAVVSDIATSAAAGTSAEFQEALPLTILALQAVENEGLLLATLNARATAIISDARALSYASPDSWGFHRRRVAAIAQLLALFPSLAPMSAMRTEAVAVARSVPWGFGGFRSPASLNLAEAVRTFSSLNDPAIVDSLDQALSSAQNIQDESFCLRQTARVNAMRLRWWNAQGFDVRTTVDRLLQEPSSPEFCTIHIVNDAYSLRVGKSSLDSAKRAKTLEAIAALYRRDPDELVRANNRRWTATEPLEAQQPVNVPDRGFLTQLTARLSAEALAQSNWDPAERVNLIRRLVPLASVSPTVLDTVLARLLIAAKPQGARLAELFTIAGAFPQLPAATVSTNLPS